MTISKPLTILLLGITLAPFTFYLSILIAYPAFQKATQEEYEQEMKDRHYIQFMPEQPRIMFIRADRPTRDAMIEALKEVYAEKGVTI